MLIVYCMSACCMCLIAQGLRYLLVAPATTSHSLPSSHPSSLCLLMCVCFCRYSGFADLLASAMGRYAATQRSHPGVFYHKAAYYATERQQLCHQLCAVSWAYTYVCVCVCACEFACSAYSSAREHLLCPAESGSVVCQQSKASTRV